MGDMQVRALTDDDRAWKEEELRRAWGETTVARGGALVEAAELPGFVAVDDEEARVGLLTYAVRDEEMEVVTIHAWPEGRGAGRALMDAALARARVLGLRRLWLSTTNNNVRAIDFYQRWGMDLASLVRDGVAVSRQVKPTIPLADAHGVPIRHELMFELVLASMGAVTIDDVRALALSLPRTTEALVRDRVKFRVGRIVYLAFARDETLMGFAFPKEERQALIESEPDKFLMPKPRDQRYHWVVVRLAAIDHDEMRELVLDAWRMVVPKRVAAEHLGPEPD
jgi:GNAT superfamily N-acetyltransferase